MNLVGGSKSSGASRLGRTAALRGETGRLTILTLMMPCEPPAIAAHHWEPLDNPKRGPRRRLAFNRCRSPVPASINWLGQALPDVTETSLERLTILRLQSFLVLPCWYHNVTFQATGFVLPMPLPRAPRHQRVTDRVYGYTMVGGLEQQPDARFVTKQRTIDGGPCQVRQRRQQRLNMCGTRRTIFPI
ncbi:hypothetical protein LZ30DRAFT_691877 [Colletotrichum cereale]|nr:hypothetical protein LZ30DRAFT_691877 [Colletotrichum cereale]